MLGSRLGPYQITAKLGEGGMGEVWRATDTRLARQVAIKVLPAAFTGDTERLARFEREAKLLAQLHHPNVASIHGLEEANGTRALVMELVEGEDLSALIARGPLPLEEALPIARQIAEALEAAHEHGIVHRDLKPANVKVAADGTVKVLDTEGRSTELAVPPAGNGVPRISPDGRWLAFGVGNGQADDDIYLYELASRRMQRLTFGQRYGYPVWSADGRRLVYTRGRLGPVALATKAADGSGEETATLLGHHYFLVESWLADGRMLVDDAGKSLDVALFDPSNGTTTPLFASATAAEYGASLSPDHRYVAYSSTESGLDQVYVESFPPGAGKWQVSSSGGMCPVFSRDGKQLFFVSGNAMTAVDVDTSAVFRSGAPRALFPAPSNNCVPPFRNFDVAPDGRFVLVVPKLVSTTPRELVVLDGWTGADPGARAAGGPP